MSTSQLTPWNLIAVTGALLAFLVGLYTLVGRERKSPYVINSVFSVFLFCVLSAFLNISSLVFQRFSDVLLNGGAYLLLVAVALTLWKVYRLLLRFSLFSVSVNPLKLQTVRIIKDRWKNLREAPPGYAHSPVPIDMDAQEEIVKILSQSQCTVEQHADLECYAAAVALKHQGQANMVLANLAMFFLGKGWLVQYTTASRHPTEFITFLKNKVDSIGKMKWAEVSNSVIVVDAYTRHFGFTDSIYFKETRRLKSQFGVHYVVAPESYAGIHTASSEAFNVLKSTGGKQVRPPTLVVYEDCAALTDLESSEQYRIFLRHVLPSERLWGGMFTVITETAQRHEDWALLSSYASIVLDMRTLQSNK